MNSIELHQGSSNTGSIKTRDARGSLFLLRGGAGRGRGKKFRGGAGQGRAGSKILGAGRVTVKHFWGGVERGGAVLKIFGTGAAFFSRSREGRTALKPFSH